MTTRTRRLTSTEREFVSLVSQAAFSNPFSDRRVAIDLQIIGLSRAVSRSERIRRVHERVAREIRSLEEAGKADLRLHVGGDRESLLIVFLFEAYHGFLEEFDRHIQDQLRAGDRPRRVGFARRFLEGLERRGFTREEAVRFFAMLFQIRRAYYFIDKGLVGWSSCMKELRRELWNSVITHDIRWYERFLLDRMEDFSTLLLGETGTGKGTAGAAIGRSGFIPFDDQKQCFVESFTRAFLSINLSQFSEMLIESELFGHKKGAFTGAVEDHEGILSLCSPHGAILLDEIGDVSIPVQIKLLQVLQDRVFSPVGGHEKLRFSGRVIAATNRSLPDLRARGAFRDDFFYRLCSNIIRVPSLRQRLDEDPGELRELLDVMIVRLTGESDPELAARVLGTIRKTLPSDYPWNGNVRELEQCVRRILLTDSYQPLQSVTRSAGASSVLARALEEGSLTSQELLEAYCAFLYGRHGTLSEVARRTELDRRTVKKYVEEARRRWGEGTV